MLKLAHNFLILLFFFLLKILHKGNSSVALANFTGVDNNGGVRIQKMLHHVPK